MLAATNLEQFSEAQLGDGIKFEGDQRAASHVTLGTYIKITSKQDETCGGS
jgi:hypothetical protein